jgi:hypothetical protein
VGTLAFQAWQFKQTIDVQRKTVELQLQTVQLQARQAEDTQWREVTKAIAQGPTVVNGITAIALLKPFLAGGSHINEARALALLLLGGISQRDVFEDLFDAVNLRPGAGALLASERASSIRDAVKISRLLRKNYEQANRDTRNVNVRGGGQPDTESPTLPNEKGEEVSNPYYVREQLDEEIGVVSNFVASQLREFGSNVPEMDFSGAALWDCDLHDTHLGKASLNNARIINVGVEGADLSLISEANGSDWSSTPWWRAKRISENLLDLLTKSFPFKSTADCPGNKPTMAEYAADVKRLRSATDH